MVSFLLPKHTHRLRSSGLPLLVVAQDLMITRYSLEVGPFGCCRRAVFCFAAIGRRRGSGLVFPYLGGLGRKFRCDRCCSQVFLPVAWAAFVGRLMRSASGSMLNFAGFPER